MVADGRFREDLYYRIKVVEVRVPPLRERREDIPPLAQHFLERPANDSAAPHKQLTAEAMRACVENPWRGNVRSLGRDRAGGHPFLGRRNHAGRAARRHSRG